MTISAHMMVKNEERWIWYTINSVIDYVDELLVCDTGSTDKTVDIIKTISNSKLKFKQVQANSKKEIAQVRQEMLKSTSADWIFVVDGDEVWTFEAMQEIRDFIDHPEGKFVGVHKFWCLIGDVYHYLPEKFGNYHIGKETGHLSIRIFKNTPQLQVINEYTAEGYAYSKVLIQDLPLNKIHHFNHRYFHTTFLPRSTNKEKLFQRKIRYQFGISFLDNIYFPEVFYLPRPDFIKSPWERPGVFYFINSLWQTPLKIIKNILLGTK